MEGCTSSSANSQEKNKNRKIAIVEDVRELSKLYQTVLRRYGHEVILTASSGEEMIAKVENGTSAKDIDVMILDYNMTGMNGFEAAKEMLRRNPMTKIIIASSADSIKTEANSVGFTYLRKPFSIENLVQAVNSETQ
jgi:CheY-like chemotaxis protein